MGKILKDGNYHLDYTPGSAVSAGEVVVLEGLLAGMAMLDIPSGGKGTLLVQGIVEVAKGSATFNPGAKVYWTGTEATSVSTDNDLLGVAAAAAASGDSTVQVMLNVATS
jgi:predicted RecA/RadA family phage recombinase